MNPPLCPYCPDFDRECPANAGVSHKICPDCLDRLDAMIADEAQRRTQHVADALAREWTRDVWPAGNDGIVRS